MFTSLTISRCRITTIIAITACALSTQAVAVGVMDGLTETVPLADETEGFMLRGSATWPTSDRDYLRRSAPVLPMLASIGYWHFPEVDYDRPEKTGGGRLGVSEFLAEGPLGIIRLSDSAFMAFRFNYEYTQLDSGVPGLGDGLELHRLELPVSFTWQPSGSQWRIFTRTSIAAKTDFDASWDDALAYSALVGAFRRVTDSLSLGLGAYYDYSMGEHGFIGGPGFVWAPNDSLSVGLVGPWLQSNWRVNDNWRLRLEGRWRSQDWAVGNSDIGGDDTQIEMRNLRALMAVERRLFEAFRANAWLSLQGGYRFMTRLEVRDADRRDLFREDADNGFFFGVAIRVQL
jgi:hypothetical protein